MDMRYYTLVTIFTLTSVNPKSICNGKQHSCVGNWKKSFLILASILKMRCIALIHSRSHTIIGGGCKLEGDCWVGLFNQLQLALQNESILVQQGISKWLTCLSILLGRSNFLALVSQIFVERFMEKESASEVQASKTKGSNYCSVNSFLLVEICNC